MCFFALVIENSTSRGVDSGESVILTVFSALTGHRETDTGIEIWVLKQQNSICRFARDSLCLGLYEAAYLS